MDIEVNQTLRQAQEGYYVVQNRVNLLLVRDYKLRKEQKQYQQQLDQINELIQAMENGTNNPLHRPNRAVITQDNYIREKIRQNSLRIRDLERKIEAQQVIEKTEKADAVHENFRKMLNGDLEKKTRETLSSLKGRVEELRKKSKELMKEIQTLEEAQKGYIDELSMQNESLREQDHKVKKLREDIRLKKQSRN